MTEQACQPLAISIAATRLDSLSPGSYVAPSPQCRILCERHETELTYCPVYGFKLRVISTKCLTPAIFYALSPTSAAESCEAAPGQGNHRQAGRRSYLAILSLTVPADRASGSTFCWHISLCARHLQSAGRWFQTRFCPAAAPGQQDAAKRQTQGR